MVSANFPQLDQRTLNAGNKYIASSHRTGSFCLLSRSNPCRGYVRVREGRGSGEVDGEEKSGVCVCVRDTREEEGSIRKGKKNDLALGTRQMGSVKMR